MSIIRLVASVDVPCSSCRYTLQPLWAARTANLPATLRTLLDCGVSLPSQDFGSPIMNSSTSSFSAISRSRSSSFCPRNSKTVRGRTVKPLLRATPERDSPRSTPRLNPPLHSGSFFRRRALGGISGMDNRALNLLRHGLSLSS